MGSWETEEDVAAARDERRGLVDPETHSRDLFDGAQEDGAGCVGAPQQKEPTVKLLPRSSNFNGSSDQDDQRRLGFEPMEQDHQEKGS